MTLPTEIPIVAVCTRVADQPRAPSLTAGKVLCCLCCAPVWLRAETIKAVFKMGRTELCPICAACCAPFAAGIHAVLTSDELEPQNAGERARQLGVAGDTPIDRKSVV